MPRNGAGQAFEIKLLGGEFADEMTCRDADCSAYREGWVSALDTSNDQMARAATWIKRFSGRRFFEWDGPHAIESALREQAKGNIVVTPELRSMLASLGPTMVVFYFFPGQQCFKQHEDREVKFNHLSPRGVYEHANGRDFNEHQNEEADRLSILRKRG